MSSITSFLLSLFGAAHGWLEICYIHGDPAAAKPAPPLRRFKWAWYTPENIAQIAATCHQLAAKYGNVYISSTIYHEQRRSAAYAIPSHGVFLDDAPSDPALPYSLVIQTSARSQQAWYFLSDPLPIEDRKRLQRNAAAALGSDRSGSDIEQVVRIPDSLNTKRGEDYPVKVIRQGAAVTIADLDNAYPQVDQAAPAYTFPLTQVEHWAGNLAALLDAHGLPRRIKNQKVRMWLESPWDNDTSAYRNAIAKSLVLHGYPDDEAIALLIHFCEAGSETKGTQWLYQDIVRLLWKIRRECPVIPSPTRTSGTLRPKPLRDRPACSRARRDRPQRLHADDLLLRLKTLQDGHNHMGCGLVLLSRHDLATRLGISLPTLDRLERQLRERGELHRQTDRQRQRSWIVLGPAPKDADLGTIIMPDHADQNGPKSPDLRHDDDSTFHGITEPQTAISAAMTMVKEEHTPPQTPAAPGGSPVPDGQAERPRRSFAELVARYRAGQYTPIDDVRPSVHRGAAPPGGGTGRCVPPLPAPAARIGERQRRRDAYAESYMRQAERQGRTLTDAEFWTIAAGRVDPPGRGGDPVRTVSSHDPSENSRDPQRL